MHTAYAQDLAVKTKAVTELRLNHPAHTLTETGILYTDRGQMDTLTDRLIPVYPKKHFFCGGIIITIHLSYNCTKTKTTCGTNKILNVSQSKGFAANNYMYINVFKFFTTQP